MSVYFYLAIYTFILLGFTFWISRKTNEEDFLIGGRNRSGFSILASKFAGAVGISTFITFTGFAYSFGSGIFWLVGGLLVGYLLFALWASPKIKQLSEQGRFYTFGDLPLSATGNTATKKLTNGVTVLVDFFGVLLSLVGGAKVIDYFGIMDYGYALLFTSALILIYVLLSGFGAVILTDIIQAFIILFLLSFTVYNLLKTDNYSTIIQNANYELPAGSLVGFIIYGSLSVFGMADRYQLCYAGKSPQAVKKGMAYSVVPILLVAALLLFVGLKAYSLNPNLDPADAFSFVVEQGIALNLLPIFLVMLFAGLMSTADTSIFAVASHLVSASSATEKVKQLRWGTVAVVILATVFSFFWKNIVDITLIGSALRIILAVPTIYILFRNKNPYRFMGSTLGGILGGTIGVIVYGISPKITLTLLLGALLGLLLKKPWALLAKK